MPDKNITFTLVHEMYHYIKKGST